MAKLSLEVLLSNYASVQQINENFAAIQQLINNSILFRDNPEGEINTMENNLDMNSFRILNLPQPVNDNEPVRLTDLNNYELLNNIDGIVPVYQPRQIGDGVTTAFSSPATGIQNPKSFEVFLSGVRMIPNLEFSYDAGTGNIDFVNAPANGATVDVIFFNPSTLLTAPTDASDIVYSGESPNVQQALDVRVPTVATLAELLLKSPSSGMLYRTKGYLVAGDGGGAHYLVKTAAEAAADGNAIDEYVNHTAANGNVFVLQYAGGILSSQVGVLESETADDNKARLVRAATSADRVDIPSGTYNANHFPFLTNKSYVAQGDVSFNLNIFGGNVVLVPLKSGCYFEGIDFFCTDDANSIRAAVDDEHNVVVSRCGFHNFVDTSIGAAWGVLIQRSSNVVLDNCEFSGNTQSDIALTDECYDIVIRNPRNATDNGVFLNVEPNFGVGVRGMSVIGGYYRTISLLENDNTILGSSGIVVTGARVDELIYDGSGAEFIGCDIKSIVPEGTALNSVFAGPLMIDTLQLSENLIDDPYVFDASTDDPNTYWVVYASAGNALQRQQSQADGKYCRINPTRINQQCIVSLRNNLTVTAGETLMFFTRARVDHSGTGTNNPAIAYIEWYDSGATLLLSTDIKCSREAVNTATGWHNNVAFVTAPTGAVSARLRLTTSNTTNTTASADFASVGLFRFENSIHGGNMRAVLGELSEPVTRTDYYQDHTLSGSLGYPGAFIGERIVNTSPSVGAPKAWSCTASQSGLNDAGTFISEGNL